MCESVFKKAWASIGGYVSSPTLAKGTPSYLVSGAHAFGVSMSDLVTAVTLVYTVVLLIGAIPGVWRTWDFFHTRRHHEEDEK